VLYWKEKSSIKTGGLLMALGETIKQLRTANGMSIEQLAAQMKVSRQVISQWESGETAPDINNLVQLSNTFDVSTDYLLKNESDADDTDEIEEIFVYTEEMQKHYNHKARVVLGALFALLGLGGVIVFWIMSIIKPVIYSAAVHGSSAADTTYTGLRAFLLGYNMTGLFIFCCFMCVIGLCTIFFSDFKGFVWNDESIMALKPEVAEEIEDIRNEIEDMHQDIEGVNEEMPTEERNDPL
jgi:transcriptional regulator with XRE-family HTH domain